MATSRLMTFQIIVDDKNGVSEFNQIVELIQGLTDDHFFLGLIGGNPSNFSFIRGAEFREMNWSF